MSTVVLADGTRIQKVEPFFEPAGGQRWKFAKMVTYNAEPEPNPAGCQAHVDIYYPNGVVVALTRGPKGGWLVRGYLGEPERSAIPKTAKRYQLHLGRITG